MNDRLHRAGPADSPERDDELAELVRLASPPDGMPSLVKQRLRKSVGESWERQLRKRAARQRWRLLAVAAAIVALLLAIRVAPWSEWMGTASSVAVAQVERVVGGGAGFGPSESVHAGDWIATGPEGSLALLASTGHAVRLAPRSRARFLAPGQIDLEKGTVYIDSGRADGAQTAIEVATPHGRVSELGTRFEVHVTPATLRVRVRDGLVVSLSNGRRHEVGAGTELSLDSSGNSTTREIAPYGPSWDWVLQVAPAPAIDGRPLSELLDWIERETGWSVEFADAARAGPSREIVLHGSIENLSPEDALRVVLPPCGMSYELRSAKLVLHEAEPSAR